MAQVYENNLWGGDKSKYYSGLGSHHPDTVNPYICSSCFFKGFWKTLRSMGGKGFGNQNSITTSTISPNLPEVNAGF